MKRPRTRGFPGFPLQFATNPLASPGGTVEATDQTAEATLHREAAEQAQLTLTDPVRLGWVLDETGDVYGGVGPNARLRLTARVTDIGPAAVDPATGHPFARLLTAPAQAAALLGRGPTGARQAQLAAETARERWGLPTARPAPIERSPCGGGAPELTRTTTQPRPVAHRDPSVEPL